MPYRHLLRRTFNNISQKFRLKIPQNCHSRHMAGTQQPPELMNETRKRKYTVTVEGNIGCGKSTLLEYFRKYPAVEPLPEPVEQWTDIHGHNGLELLYHDPARWSFTFNNYVMLSRLRLHEHVSTVPVKMMERSLLSTQHIFVENAFQSGMLTHFEYSVLIDWFNWLTSFTNVNIDLIVYLRVSPDVCFQRINLRDRKAESRVPLELIKDLHALYDTWLMGDEHTESLPPVMVIDASPAIPELEKLYEEKKSDITCGCL